MQPLRCHTGGDRAYPVAEMNCVTLRDLRKGHPFGVSSPTDTYYVRIAKAVFDKLRCVSFCAERSDEEMKHMAIKQTL